MKSTALNIFKNGDVGSTSAELDDKFNFTHVVSCQGYRIHQEYV